jgi:nucleolar protein 15
MKGTCSHICFLIACHTNPLIPPPPPPPPSTEYFSQFGRVHKIRLSRNKKTGKSKHYAFLEFQNAAVAQVVADAMDGYMFFGQKLSARVMRRAEVHPELFKGANRVFKKVPWKKIEMERHNKAVDGEVAAKRTAAATKRNKARAEAIKEAGIDYEFPGAGAAAPAAKKAKKAAPAPATAAKGKGKKKAEKPVEVVPVVEKKKAVPVKKAAAAAAPAAAEKPGVTPPRRVTRARAAATVTKKAPAPEKEAAPKRKAVVAKEETVAPATEPKKRRTAAAAAPAKTPAKGKTAAAKKK